LQSAWKQFVLTGPIAAFLNHIMKAVTPLIVMISTLLTAAHSQADLPPIISRDVLFGNPERTSPELSPDGSRLAWLAPDTKNVLQVWVKTVGKDDDKIVTADKKRGIRQYYWAKDNRTLLYLQDSDGDENFHIYGVDLADGNVRDYTPFQGVRASVTDLNPDHPNEVVVELNLRDRHLFDVHRLNLRTGALELDTQNPGDVSAWATDPNFRVRAAQISTPDGGTELRIRSDEKAPWKTLLKVGPEEILNWVSFTGDGQGAYLISSIGRDTAAVVEKNLATGAEKVVAASDEVDADTVVVHPKRYVVEAVSFSPGRTTWQVVDPAVKDDFAGLAKVNDGDFFIVSRTEADDVWLVGYQSDRAPGKFYRWDRRTKTGSFLFDTRPKLEGLALAEMKAVTITARDGLLLHSYLTLPVGVPPRNLPMVLFPHGGPWARDRWGFNPYAQWLANRGYAVLMPNFRGSTGYGKKHLNAGNRQWGLKMHDDLIDCVNWAVKEGYADPKKIGIMGGSYGGYCALAAVTFTPDTFACSVDIVGPSNLKTLIGTIPPYWKPMRSQFNVRMGNVDDPNDAELIQRASPLNFANKIVRPLLIGQGANDPRVKQAESEQIVNAIQQNRGSVIYVVYPDEGHGFARPENRTDFNARAEVFLGAHLGGRVEPMSGDKIPGSTAVVRVIGGAP
jgi:dipeptidyl aminopeptidase/acylaminoacyl peptidase